MHGEYEVSLDEKNRLAVPAELRKNLNPGPDSTLFFLKLGINGKPWMYSPARLQEIAASSTVGLSPTFEQLELAQFHNGPTWDLTWDKQGRVVIPERVLTRTKLGKDLILVGVHDHVEMWNTADWEAHMDGLLAKYAMKGTSQTQQVQAST